MTDDAIADTANRVSGAAADEAAGYGGGADRPLGSYAAVLGVYAAALAGFGLAVRASGRSLPERLGAADLALAAVATYKVSRLVSKETVTSPLRAPFTRYVEPQGPSELHEEVRGTGARESLGELLSCPFCTSQWVATGFIGGLAVAPRATRFLASIFSAVAISDVLQFVYSAVQEKVEG